jgi:hypothetical protein
MTTISHITNICEITSGGVMIAAAIEKMNRITANVDVLIGYFS